MVDNREYTFVCLIDLCEDVLPISDLIIKTPHEKYVLAPTRVDPRTYQSADGLAVKSPAEVQISSMLNTCTGKCWFRIFCKQIVPNENSNNFPDATCAWEIVSSNPLIIYSVLIVTDSLLNNIQRLASIDYETIHSSAIFLKIGWLGLKLAVAQTGGSSIDPDDELTFDRVTYLVHAGDFPLNDGDEEHYRNVENLLQNAEKLITLSRIWSSGLTNIYLPATKINCVESCQSHPKFCHVKMFNEPPAGVQKLKLEF